MIVGLGEMRLLLGKSENAGGKYALMTDTYDAASPAGIDENKHGGLLSDWTVQQMENDYTDTGLATLYNAQVNPIVFDNSYGWIVQGDGTMQVENSDTSFIGTKRLYKYIAKVIESQILLKQVFKVNDSVHYLKTLYFLIIH